MTTQKDIDYMVQHCGLQQLHTSFARGYISRKTPRQDYYAEKYRGLYGKGYKVHSPSRQTTLYHHVTYYVWS